jgi:hypothetical protein
MASLSDYFAKQPRYTPKWEYGSRVFGHWNKIPFVGMVVADRERDHILVHSDLPIIVDGKLNNVIIVKHKDIKSLVNYEESTSRNSGSERKTKGKVDLSTDLQVLPTAKLEVAGKTKRSQKTNKGV